MHKGVQISIAEKVKNKAIDCHEIHKTSGIGCEVQYVDYYKHCLRYFGCEITENLYDGYLGFIVFQPENLDLTIDGCITDYAQKQEILSQSKKKPKEFKFDASHFAFFMLGMLFIVIVAAISLYAT